MAMQDPPMKPGRKPQKKDTATISGTVTAVTDTSLTIVDATKAEHTIAITSETQVTKGGKDAALADVKANDGHDRSKEGRRRSGRRSRFWLNYSRSIRKPDEE